MEQPAGYSKNPLNLYPFCEKASAESPLEWSKWAAILEVGVFAKNEIEVRNLLRNKPELVEAAEPMSKVKITDKTYAQKKNRDDRNQEKRLYDVLEVVFVTTRILAFERYNFICRQQKKTERLHQTENRKTVMLETKRSESVGKTARKKSGKKKCCVIHSPGMRRMQKSAVIFYHASAQSGNDRQVQQKRLNLDLHNVTTKDFMTVLEAVFVTTKILAFERYNFICRKQKKTESLAQLPAD